MVYCGKPSASCGNCRAKKRRCDKAKPTCGQCRRMAQDCPGYRDLSSLLFRDETIRTISKHATQDGRQLVSSAAPTPTDATGGSSCSPSSDFSFHPDRFASAQQEFISEYDEDVAEAVEMDEELQCLEGLREQEQHVSSPSLSLGTFLCPGSKSSPSPLPPPSIQFAMPSTPLDLSCLDLFPGPQMPLSLPMEDLGMNHFLTNYVAYGFGPLQGFLDYAMPLLTSGTDSKILVPAMQAVGLAGIANASRQTGLMRKARSRYAQALKLASAAIVSTDGTCQQDGTILAVIILGLFESLTCSGSESLEAWAAHINSGIVSLLVSRGPAQFQTPVGIFIFREAVSQILTSCVRIGAPIPPRIILLRAQASQFVDTSDPAWIMTGIFIKVMDLYQRVNVDLGEDEDWERHLSEAVTLDGELEGHFTFPRLSGDWQFKTINDPASNTEIVYQGTYHVYSDTFVAKIWNAMRACRIMANFIVVDLFHRNVVMSTTTSSSSLETYSALQRHANDNMASMRDGILASVPHMLGYVSSTSPWLTTLKSDSPASAPLGGYFLLWFLYLGGQLPNNPPDTRQWIVNRLRAITTLTGVQKASYLATLLELGPLPSM